MNSTEELIRFICPGCDTPLTTVPMNAGQRICCTHCSTGMTIPGQAPSMSERPVAHPLAVTAKQKDVVPLKIALPNNLGGIESSVTQGTANGIAKVVIGGFLVAIGFVLAMFFGSRKPSA
jgi:hypothetical protein